MKQILLLLLLKVRKDIANLTQQITDFKKSVDDAFTQVNNGLDNIQADETNLLQQIKDLQTQIGSGLSAEDQAALAAVVTEAQSVVSRTKVIADNVPDVPPVPPPPPPPAVA